MKAKRKAGVKRGVPIVLVRARTCTGCRAYLQDRYTGRCTLLGFKCSIYGVPEQPCPKPKTVAEYFDTYREIMAANAINNTK